MNIKKLLLISALSTISISAFAANPMTAFLLNNQTGKNIQLSASDPSHFSSLEPNSILIKEYKYNKGSEIYIKDKNENLICKIYTQDYHTKAAPYHEHIDTTTPENAYQCYAPNKYQYPTNVYITNLESST